MTEPLPIAAALREALARALDCDPEEVTVTVDAPGIDGRYAQVTVAMVDAPETPEDDSVNGDPQAQVAPAEPDDDEDVDVDGSSPANEAGDDAEGEERVSFVTPEDLDEEADAAADFLEGLLDALDLPGDLRIQVHADHAEIELIDIGTGALIGRRGQTLEAIQELVRCSLQREFQRRSRVMIDAEGYRSRRLEKLLEKAEEAIDAVLDTGEAERLEPMDVFERKAVHRLVASVDGVSSRSQGREPARRIIIEQS